MQAPASIGEFLQELSKRGWLKRINEEVDPFLEITALSETVMKAGGPALVFDRVKGAACPLAINLFGSKERMALALGVEDVSEIAQRLKGLMEMQMPAGLWAKISMALPKLKELSAFAPKRIKDAPCQEVRLMDQAASLDLLPIITCQLICKQDEKEQH